MAGSGFLSVFVKCLVILHLVATIRGKRPIRGGPQRDVQHALFNKEELINLFMPFHPFLEKKYLLRTDLPLFLLCMVPPPPPSHHPTLLSSHKEKALHNMLSAGYVSGLRLWQLSNS